MDTNKLAMEIVAYRHMMNKSSEGKSLTDPDVIRLRQGLDTLIRNYIFELRRVSDSPPTWIKGWSTGKILLVLTTENIT